MSADLLQLLEQADAALNAGDLETAEAMLAIILEQAPDLPDGLARLGLIRLRQSKAVEAEAMLARAAAQVPDAASLRFHVGLAQMEQSDTASDARALTSFAQAIALDPGFTPAYHAAGSKGLVMNPPLSVSTILSRAHRLVPGHDDITHALDMAVLADTRRFERVSDDDSQRAQLALEIGTDKPTGPLKITFVDPMDWDYDVASPETKPMGGSQSALCYLARSLARLDHQVSTVTGLRNPTSVHRVDCRSLAQGLPRGASAPDIVVILNAPGSGPAVRAQMREGARLILWTQHAPDQAAMRVLEDPAVVQCFDAIVCVSDWHREIVKLRYNLHAMPMFVQRNGIGPRFEDLAKDPQSLRVQKAGPPILIYSSTPFRGLELLLDAFPRIRAAHPDAQLRVFSSLQVYNAAGPDPYSPLYARARAMAGVDYRGSVGQADLARALSAAHILSYPNTFPETSCISVMEAMAAGLHVVSSHLGALPETGLGRAALVTFPPGPPDRDKLVADFTAVIIATLDERRARADRWLSARIADAEAILSAANWQKRTQEWLTLFAFLSNLR